MNPETVDSQKSTSENQVAENNKPEKSTNSLGKTKTYVVKKGDNLYKIAKLNKMNVEELKRINKLTDKSKLLIGMKLKVNRG